jgi:hypothetical protein
LDVQEQQTKAVTSRASAGQKQIIGWREWVGLPDLGILHIKAKVDSGARTSALHAFYVTRFDRDGRPWVKFGVHPLQGCHSEVVECEAPVKDIRRVTDSGGHAEWRPVIETSLMIQGSARLIEVTLTDRETMMFRMLIGRSALKRRYLVDSGRSFLLGGNKNLPNIE